MRTPVVRYRDGSFTNRPDSVAGEEPLEIRVDGRALTVTMRTPGGDIDLVHGFLHAEGIIAGPEDVRTIRYCEGATADGVNTYNVLDVALADTAPGRHGWAPRSLTTSSSCGVCGTASIEALTATARHPIPDPGLRLHPDAILGVGELLRAGQRGFASTGGLHAAALLTPAGALEHLREDVGRHNAVDKVIGAALAAAGLPIPDRALVTSSRASFELVQKALLAGVGTLIAVSAASSLAVELARGTGMTLIGFARATGFNVYAGAHRVIGALPEPAGLVAAG